MIPTTRMAFLRTVGRGSDNNFFVAATALVEGCACSATSSSAFITFLGSSDDRLAISLVSALYSGTEVFFGAVALGFSATAVDPNASKIAAHITDNQRAK